MSAYSRIGTVAILFGVSLLFFRAVERSALETALLDVCDRIESEYVRASEPKVRSFVATCRSEASLDVDRALSVSRERGVDARRVLIDRINEKLSVLRVSHLEAFSPAETGAIWSGQAVDTGARARMVDAEIVILRVIPGSSAARAGIRRGDVIVAVEGSPLDATDEVESRSGVWDVLRPDDTRVQIPVRAEPLQDLIVPHWLSDQETKQVSILRIPSFLPQAFDGEEWQQVLVQIGELQESKRTLVVDLRGNTGGSFPAMLRALGALTCETNQIGWVHRGEFSEEKLTTNGFYLLPDDLSAELQLELLGQSGIIALMPFKTKHCYGGPIVVLVDQGTSSVAEIFAQAIKERGAAKKNARVMGWRTSGRVVMARWFQIRGLSEDYTVSIPVALYRTSKGEELESRGVSPDQILTDDLARWRSRRDPWIADAVRTVSF